MRGTLIGRQSSITKRWCGCIKFALVWKANHIQSVSQSSYVERCHFLSSCDEAASDTDHECVCSAFIRRRVIIGAPKYLRWVNSYRKCSKKGSKKGNVARERFADIQSQVDYQINFILSEAFARHHQPSHHVRSWMMLLLVSRWRFGFTLTTGRQLISLF